MQKHIPTLEHFIPIWTKIHTAVRKASVEQQYDVKCRQERKHNVQYSDSTTCLVGEAHGFSNIYIMKPQKCYVCCRLYVTPARLALYGTDKEFNAFKKKLYKHMKKVHWK